MCVTAAGRVVGVDEVGAVVEIDGRRRRYSNPLGPPVRPGDWVLVAVGSIVDRVSAREALELRAALVAVMPPAGTATEARRNQP